MSFYNSHLVIRNSCENDFTTRKSHVSLPRTQPFKRISQGTFSRERSQLLYPRVTTVALLFINSTPSEVLAIPCVLFGNPLRALFLKNRDFFCHGVIFVPNTRGPLGCLLGVWPSGPKPCGGNHPYDVVEKFNRRLVLRERTRHFLYSAEYSSTCYILEIAHMLVKKYSMWRFYCLGLVEVL